MNCQDDGCEEIINLRYKNGSWRTVGQKTTLWEYDHACRDLFYHDEINSTGTSIYIGYCSGDHKVYLIDTTNKSKSELKQLSLAPPETFKHFTSLKNILIVTTDKNVYNFKWDDNTLAYLELSKDIIPDLYFQYESTDSLIILPKDKDDGGLQTQAALFDQILIEKYKKRQKGLFCHSWVVIQWAYRMWDGSYIMHSQPYLLKLGTDESYYYRRLTEQADENNNYGCALDCGVPTFYVKAATNVLTNLDKWKGLITHLCVFMSQDVSRYLFEYNGTPYNTDAIAEYYTFGDNTDSLNQLLNVYPYYLSKEIKIEEIVAATDSDKFTINLNESINKLNYDGDGGENITDKEKIPVRHNTYSWKKLGHGNWLNLLYGGFGALTKNDQWNRVSYTQEDAEQTVETTDDAGSFILQSQPELPVDDFSHHTLIADIQPYVFNAKLHLGSVKSKFSNPQNISLWDGAPMGFSLTDNYPFKFYQEVTIETDRGTRIVFQEVTPYVFVSPFTEYAVIVPSVVSYPDARATKIRLIIKKQPGTVYYQMASYELKSHKIYNFAYAITNEYNDASEFIPYLSFDNDTFRFGATLSNSFTPTAVLTDNRYYNDTNRVQVSKVNNALYYPSLYSYQFGGSETDILAFGSQSAPVSLGQFGQYPLTVFTSQGTYLMQQGNGMVIYSAIVPLNNEVIFKSSVCELGGAMIYASRDGVKLLSGNKLQHISREVEGEPSEKLKYDNYYINFITDPNGHLVFLYPYLSEENFLDYLDDNVRICYDKMNKEIIITNRDLFLEEGREYHVPYSYVYNLQYKTWHKITDSWHQFLLINSRWYGAKNYRVGYPTGLGLHDMTEETEVLQDCMIQSRPMKLGSYDFKKVKAVIQRSLCYVGDPIDSSQDADDKFGLYMFASLENNIWKFIKGIKVSQTAGMIQSPSLPAPHASVRHISLLTAVKSKDMVLSHWELLREITYPANLGAEARLDTEHLLGSYDADQYGESYDIGSSTENLP